MENSRVLTNPADHFLQFPIMHFAMERFPLLFDVTAQFFEKITKLLKGEIVIALPYSVKGVSH